MDTRDELRDEIAKGNAKRLTGFEWDDLKPHVHAILLKDADGVVDTLLAKPDVVLAALVDKIGTGGVLQHIGWEMFPAEQEADGEWGEPYCLPVSP